MRITAIIQSFNYADMLSITLPLNKGFFDDIEVWTKTGDEATKAICAKEGITCIETDLFTLNGDKFNRGRAFNEAFRRIIRRNLIINQVRPEWVCILDSDVVLPPTFRETLNEMERKGEIDKECFYGARRYDVTTLEMWNKVKNWDQEELDKCVLFRGYGYSYFSLNHMGSSTFVRLWNQTGGNPYYQHPDGSEADWRYRNNWGSYEWNPPTLPPDNILDHSIQGIVDPPNGLLRQLPFNVIHLGVPGIGATGRGTPVWNVSV